MRRFDLGKGMVLACTVALVGLFDLGVCGYLVNAGYRLTARLPVYEGSLAAIYGRVTPFLAAHGFEVPGFSTTPLFSPDRLMGFAGV